MALFEDCFDYVFARETKKSNPDYINDDPSDRGGITKYGISLRFLKNLSADDLKKVGIFGEANENTICTLSKSQAKDLYKYQFWDKAPFVEIKDKNVCSYIFDMAFNSGVAPSIKCAQRACWAIMQSRIPLIDDGICGNITISYINLCGSNLILPLKSERANFYKMVVERNPSQSIFLEGWLNRTYG